MKKKITIAFISFIVQVFFLWCIIIINNVDKETWLNIFFVILLISATINLYAIKLSYNEILNLPTLFILFTYLFHFGHLPLMVFEIEIDYPISILDRVSMPLLIESWIFSYIIVNLTTLGVLVFSALLRMPNLPKLDKVFWSKINLKKFRVIGYIFVIIGIIPKIYIDLTKINVFLAKGYLAIYTVDISSVYYILSNFFFLGIALLLLTYSSNKRITKIILFFALAIYLFSMFSGGRAEATVSIVLLIYIYIKFVDSIRLSTLGVLYGIALFITEITKFRQNLGIKISDFILNFSIENIFSPITAVLAEFGGTQLTVALALEHFPRYSQIEFAENYLLGIIYVFPLLSNVFPIALDNIAYISQFPNNEGQYLGGSYIGELYFGLNKYAYIGAFIIGGLLSVFNYIMYKILCKKNIINFVCFLFIFGNVLWWVRDYFNIIMQDFIIIFILAKIIEYLVINLIIKRFT